MPKTLGELGTKAQTLRIQLATSGGADTALLQETLVNTLELVDDLIDTLEHYVGR